MFDELRREMNEVKRLVVLTSPEDPAQLEARTEKWARPLEGDVAGDTMRVVAFSIGGEQYGWPVNNVRAIAQLGHLTPVPKAPPYYRGVINYRGRVLSILDLRAFLGAGLSEPIPQLVVVIAGAKLEIGVLADDVFDVAIIRPEDISGEGPEPELIRGVTRRGLSLLNAEALLEREARRVSEANANTVI